MVTNHRKSPHTQHDLVSKYRGRCVFSHPSRSGELLKSQGLSPAKGGQFALQTIEKERGEKASRQLSEGKSFGRNSNKSYGKRSLTGRKTIIP